MLKPSEVLIPERWSLCVQNKPAKQSFLGTLEKLLKKRSGRLKGKKKAPVKRSLVFMLTNL